MISEKKPVVWVVEDDESSVFVYQEILRPTYDVSTFASLTDFQTTLAKSEENGGKFPDLVIADLNLSDTNFMNFFSTRKLKSSDSVLVVSSIDDIDVLRECYSYGVRDYLIKPFKVSELRVKIERILRPSSAPNGGADEIKSNEPFKFDIDVVSLQAVCDGEHSPTLTSKEFQMLSIFKMADQFRVTRENLVQSIWRGLHVSSKTLDVHLFNLRKKLAAIGMAIDFEAPNFYQLLRRPMQ